MRSYLRFSALSIALAFAAPHAVWAQADAIADAQKLLKQGQFQQALDKTDAYVASKPKDAQGRFLRGLILTEMNRSADAIAVFTKLTEDFPELPEPYNNLAVLYAQQKQYDKSRAALEMAIRTHPSYAIAHENLGDVYSKLASQAYDKALQLDSSNSAAQTKLSLIRDLITVSAKQTGGKPVAGKTTAEPTKVAAADLGRPIGPASKPVPAPVATVAPVAPSAMPAPPAPVAAPTKVEKPVAVEKSAEKAAEKAGEKPVAAGNADADVKQAVSAWASAWGRKDVKAYLAHYAPDFQTPNGQNRKAWEGERESRINKPGKIEVSIDNVQVGMSGADKATVKFRQHYKSASLKTSANKTLILIRVGGKWLIQQERVG